MTITCHLCTSDIEPDFIALAQNQLNFSHWERLKNQKKKNCGWSYSSTSKIARTLCMKLNVFEILCNFGSPLCLWVFIYIGIFTMPVSLFTCLIITSTLRNICLKTDQIHIEQFNWPFWCKIPQQTQFFMWRLRKIDFPTLSYMDFDFS